MEKCYDNEHKHQQWRAHKHLFGLVDLLLQVVLSYNKLFSFLFLNYYIVLISHVDGQNPKPILWSLQSTYCKCALCDACSWTVHGTLKHGPSIWPGFEPRQKGQVTARVTKSHHRPCTFVQHLHWYCVTKPSCAGVDRNFGSWNEVTPCGRNPPSKADAFIHRHENTISDLHVKKLSSVRPKCIFMYT